MDQVGTQGAVSLISRTGMTLIGHQTLGKVLSLYLRQRSKVGYARDPLRLLRRAPTVVQML